MITSIYDVNAPKKENNSLLDEFNYFFDSKQSGVLQKNSFAKIVRSIGDFAANRIRQGKMTNEAIESVESYISTFVGENANKYFDFPHEGLAEADKYAFNQIRTAKQALEQRSLYTQPVKEQENYENTFKKLGH